jgi:hypothetical protein
MNQEILELRNLILEAQFTLLDTGNLELIDSGSSKERVDSCFKVTMLLPQEFDSTVDNFAVQTNRSRASFRLSDASGRRRPGSTPWRENCVFPIDLGELW